MTPQMIKAITTSPPTTGTTIKIVDSVSKPSDPSFLEENRSVGERVGGQVETSSTTVFEGSTTGAPNTTEVDVVIVADPAATDWSTQREAVAGSAKEVATYRRYCQEREENEEETWVFRSLIIASTEEYWPLKDCKVVWVVYSITREEDWARICSLRRDDNRRFELEKETIVRAEDGMPSIESAVTEMNASCAPLSNMDSSIPSRETSVEKVTAVVSGGGTGVGFVVGIRVGEFVGDKDGLGDDGARVGTDEGVNEGVELGDIEGLSVGKLEGASEGKKEGWELGDWVGEEVGENDGEVGRKLREGINDGAEDGEAVGATVGRVEGVTEGEELGTVEGVHVGENDGKELGETVGRVEGVTEGEKLGTVDGVHVGENDGKELGETVGRVEGVVEGERLGTVDGTHDGEKDGVVLGEKVGEMDGLEVG
jgi:hypothetical protein